MWAGACLRSLCCLQPQTRRRGTTQSSCYPGARLQQEMRCGIQKSVQQRIQTPNSLTQMRGVREAGTYGAAASPAHWAGPSATVPHRWSHPGSTSVPSRSAAHRSTRPHSALRRGKTSSRSPGGQQRWLVRSLCIERGRYPVLGCDFLDKHLLSLLLLHTASGSPAHWPFLC